MICPSVHVTDNDAFACQQPRFHEGFHSYVGPGMYIEWASSLVGTRLIRLRNFPERFVEWYQEALRRAQDQL